MGGIAALSSAMTGIKVASSLVGGVQSFIAGKQSQSLYNQEADAQMREGQILAQEAQAAAEQKAREGGKVQSKQALQYASSGITLEGTPLLVMEETRHLAQQEVDALIQRGQAQAQIAAIRAAGIRTAGAVQAASGRNAMFGSLFTAAGQGIEGYISGKRLGVYGNTGGGPLAAAP